MREATSLYFLNNGVYNIGTIKEGTEGIALEYIPTDKFNPDEVEFIKPGCGCTADVKVTTDENGKSLITGIYNDSSNYSKTVQGDKPKEHSFTKSITVFFKDDQPLTNVNSLGNPVFNDQKKHILLYLSGTVTWD